MLDPAAGPAPQELALSRKHADAGAGAWLDGALDTARVELAEALEIDPRNPTALALLDGIDGSGRDMVVRPIAALLQEGLELRFKRKHGRALECFRKAVALGHESALTAAMSGYTAFRVGKSDLAEKELTAAAELAPGSWWIAMNLGEVYIKRGKLESAGAELKRAVRSNPGEAGIWRLLARVHEKQKNPEDGIRAVRKALSLAKKDDPKLLVLLGALFNEKGDQEQAREVFWKVLKQDPENVDALFGIALSHDNDHHISETEAAYRKVLEIDPDHAGAMICLANLYSGAERGSCLGCDRAYAAHPELLDPERAESYLLQAIETSRGSTEAVTESGLSIALRLQNRDRVIRLLERLTSGREKTLPVLRLERLLRRIRLAEEG